MSRARKIDHPRCSSDSRCRTDHEMTIECPRCRKTVRIIQFGRGYVAVCCDWIIYHGDEPPRVSERERDA